MVALTRKIDEWSGGALHRELCRFVKRFRGRRVRSRVQFARECIVIPEGPHEGEHWRPHYQPFSHLYLEVMDKCGFRKFRFTGCVQSGKTLLGIIVVLWHLFERGETVIFGVPDIDTVGRDKWTEELLPIIQASPELAKYLPTKGPGSKGGFAQRIKFTNGATLRFMAAGGKDHRRSAFTAPVVFKTEVDRYDEAGEISREAAPVEQMEARTEAFGDRAFSYEECTVTTEKGRIWTEFNRGTATELYSQCPHCLQYVLIGRDDFVGVDDAHNVDDAVELGAFKCPSCDVLLSDGDRASMLSVDKMVPVHRGQSVVVGGDGAALLEGDMPKVDFVSFRWNAFHNKFWSTRKIAVDEWNAMFGPDPDDADLKRRQFAWTEPADPEEFDLVPLTISDVYGRVAGGVYRGSVPVGSRLLTLGGDVRQTELHYVVRAWSVDETGKVSGRAIDFDVLPVDSKQYGVREAILRALAELRESVVLRGYFDEDGKRYPVNYSLIDASWQEDVIFSFMFDCEEKGIKGWYPIMGRGQSEPPGKGSYVQPKDASPEGPVLWIGEQCHIRRASDHDGMVFVMANSDEWKAFVHDGYATPEGRNGALSHFVPRTTDEKRLVRRYARHLVAERRVRKIVPRRGPVDVFVDDSRLVNHFLDCDYYACVGGNLGGIKVATRGRRVASPRSQQRPIRTPEGRPFLSVK